MNGTNWNGIVAHLEQVAAKNKDIAWCVVGAGNGGLAMAGHLGLMGFRVSMYNRTDEHLNAVRWYKGIEIEGVVKGFGRVLHASSHIEEAIVGADVIMIVTPSTAHYSLASLMAPFLRDGQIVVLNPGRTGGALEFKATIERHGCTARIIVAEAQTFLYASRMITRNKAHIFSIKNGVPVSALPSFLTPALLKVLDVAFPQFTAGSNVLATSIENIGAVFHPALTLLNAGWIESTGGNFEYYLQGISPSVARVCRRSMMSGLRSRGLWVSVRSRLENGST